ncbi:hypothetical protein [uncultured Helicobacter sp.]|uniref:hypothetical protein n=1 Tax=uncultured Helicobacter sp. TaxID=175537 RepID=UPI0026149F0A|nr:hypothetical protein [uncultured Helicobacter sp.]
MNTITSSTSAQETKALSELFAQRANLQSNLQATPESNAQSKLDSSKSAESAVSKPESTNAVKEDFSMQSFLNALAPNTQASELARAQAAQGVSGVKGLDENLGSAQDPYDSLHKIKDTFTPSKELSAAMNAKSYVKHGLADVDSFKLMARQLQADGVLNRDDMMAVDFLSAKSPNISLQDFDAMIKNDNLSREMRGLISQLVQKLHMVNYISGGLMSA